jgi:leucyl-tRNA synthetase
LPIIPVIDRTDGLTKSLALKGTMETGFEKALAEAGIPYTVQEDGSLGITIPKEKVSEYLACAKRFIKAGCWNEVVGTEWLFIFEDEIVYWDSIQSERAILARCRSLQPAVGQYRTVMEMLHSVAFYQDVLFHHDYGDMIHSEEFSGTLGESAIQVVIEYLEKKKIGKRAVNYRLRDWLISRQRYWGAPIPMVYCEKCGWNPVPESQLPIELPEDVAWRPTGESPLKFHPTWLQTTCPVCGEAARREIDTMDTFMCSSWYHLRYLSPDYDQGMFNPTEYDYWMPVDTYTGGIEHATMHLIYTRFFHKAGRDMGIMEGHEPMLQLRNQGMVLGEDGEKMSKSRGNVIAPDELVAAYGADVVRAYLMFFARWDLGGPWDSQGVEGPNRWLRRVWTLFTEKPEAAVKEEGIERWLRRKVHQTLMSVTHDFEAFEFNTIVSSLMELLNNLYAARERGAFGTAAWEEAMDLYVRMLAPVTPHLAEELWVEVLGQEYSVHTQVWPTADEEAAREEEITLVVQVNGRVRDRIQVAVDISEDEARVKALQCEGARRFVEGLEVVKVIYVPGRLVNIVVKE